MQAGASGIWHPGANAKFAFKADPHDAVAGYGQLVFRECRAQRCKRGARTCSLKDGRRYNAARKYSNILKEKHPANQKVTKQDGFASAAPKQCVVRGAAQVTTPQERRPQNSASCERTRYQSASLGAVRRAGHSAIRALTSPAQPPAPAGRLRAQVRMLFEIIARFQPKCAENAAAEDAKRTDLPPHIPFAIF